MSGSFRYYSLAKGFNGINSTDNWMCTNDVEQQHHGSNNGGRLVTSRIINASENIKGSELAISYQSFLKLDGICKIEFWILFIHKDFSIWHSFIKISKHP